MQCRLDGCLDDMAASEFGGPEDLKRAAERLWSVYSDEDFRHRYSNFVDTIESHEDAPAGDLEAKERLNLLVSAEQAIAENAH